MIVAHLTASTFFGGPERQMLGLARQLWPGIRSVFLSFAEGGACRAFLEEAGRQGFLAHALSHDTPWLRAAVRELTQALDRLGIDVLCCHGYKADLLGRIAARRRGIPAVAVSRGWTAESFKVRLYETLDRINLRWMDRVVCVSQGQAARVLRAGVDPARTVVIRNAIDVNRFVDLDLRYLRWLHERFPRPRRYIIGSAGRLSPEKGVEILVEAAARVHARDQSLGFIHFGDGLGRQAIERAIERAGLRDVFILAGLKADLDRYYPFFDLLALPSFTEGLPNVVLEAFAARVPVVATAVGGTPEVVEDGVSGYLVSPGEPDRLADRILDVLADEERRLEMGRCGYRRVCADFTFAAQARQYARLLMSLLPGETRQEQTLEETPAEQERSLR
jgi:glycosyltransferase involved in cell wall biosynthesis